MHHHHDHHDHDRSPGSFGRAFAIGVFLNLAYVGAEAFYGIASHSLALLADAGHNFADVLALAAAWSASILSRRGPGGRYTYGFRASPILVPLANSALLLLITAAIPVGCSRRFPP